nr:hypothetical protein [Tanacetum cinerariifolium]
MKTQTSNTLHNAIMEAGSKDRPPMLAPGNYIQWKSRIKRYIDTKPNHELIHYCLENPPYELGWKTKPILDSDGNPTTLTERVCETYKSVTQEIRDQLNAKAEAFQIILTGIDNDIYSTVDACPNACEMWKAIERLKQGESINVQDLETNLFWEFGKFTLLDGESLESYYSRFYKIMNELTKNQCNVTNHQVNVQFLLQLQPEWQRFMTLVKQSQELKNVSYQKLYDILKQHLHEVNEIRAEKIAHSDTPDTPPSPIHGTPFTEITASTQRSPAIPCRRKRVGPLHVDSSSRLSFSDHSSPDLLSTSTGGSRKRCKSPMTFVPALPPISRALSHVCTDLIPSPKRLRDFGYLADVEVGPREASLRDDVIPRDAHRDRGINARVVVEVVDQDKIETGVRGPVEGHRIIGVESAVAALTERLAELERDNRRLRGTASVESQRVDRLQRGISCMKR